ncbi:DNA polymerase ligase N-terminal domain-containing protein [Candidatus Caldatribacterium sp. SIUC1]|uniref:DNA polymerase ligase N-terminal domain-containing protein n=1 Tax=Candidatus Caldatribacterium sp. SIUC1 TaxID=3418365 RepID=UPI003F693FA8
MSYVGFTIHEHRASHHHCDLRLERDRVLRSFAMPRGIPRVSGERRLAIPVEDHPLFYADFEGEIPEGYGEGVVRIWDKGNCEAEKWTDGEMLARFLRRRIQGPYALIRFRKGNWLFIRRKEEGHES